MTKDNTLLDATLENLKELLDEHIWALARDNKIRASEVWDQTRMLLAVLLDESYNEGYNEAYIEHCPSMWS